MTPQVEGWPAHGESARQSLCSSPPSSWSPPPTAPSTGPGHQPCTGLLTPDSSRGGELASHDLVTPCQQGSGMRGHQAEPEGRPVAPSTSQHSSPVPQASALFAKCKILEDHHRSAFNKGHSWAVSLILKSPELNCAHEHPVRDTGPGGDMKSRSGLSPPQHTWGQSPLGSCFLRRHLTPLSRASTSGCLREEEAANKPSPLRG